MYEKEWLSVNEAAQLMGFSRQQLYNLLSARKDLPCYRPTGKRGRIFLNKEDINRWIKRSKA
jgi:excisionase family DNA binding protein